MSIVDKLNSLKDAENKKKAAEEQARKAEHEQKHASGKKLADELWTILQAQQQGLKGIGFELKRNDDLSISVNSKDFNINTNSYDGSITLTAGRWDPKWHGVVSNRNPKLDRSARSADEAEQHIASIVHALQGGTG